MKKSRPPKKTGVSASSRDPQNPRGKPALVPKLRFLEFRDAAGWKEQRLSALVRLVSGMHLSPEQYGKESGTPYFTGPSDFTNDIRNITKWTNESISLAEEDDTLITVKGSGVGEIWYLTLPMVAMGRQLMAIRSEVSSSRFVYQFLLTKRTRFEDYASGNLIPGLSRGDILDLEAHFPTFPEQQKIAECLSSLDELMTAQARKLDAIKTHKKGLMQQLFPAKAKPNPASASPNSKTPGSGSAKPWGNLPITRTAKLMRKTSRTLEITLW